MDYLQLVLELDAKLTEELVNELYVNDIENLAIEDPKDVAELLDKKESYEWDYVDEKLLAESDKAKITIYLQEDDSREKEAVEKILRQEKFKDVKIFSDLLKEADWKDKWKEFFKPTAITDRITVKPSWESYEKQRENELIINIDPGMAFGTGTHETTSLCIKLMEKYYKEGNSLLDVGTGSGILAIAARLLGIKDITAVDIDPVAVSVARENLLANHMSDVKVLKGDLTKGLNLKVDMVLANLMADLVMMLSKSVLECLEKDGIFISSGVLVEKCEQVAKELENNGFTIVEIMKQGEWCAIAAKKKDE